MINSKKLLTTISAGLCLMSAFISPITQATVISSSPDTIVSVSADGDENSVGTVNSGSLSSSELIVRERKNTSQESLRIATFFDFDLSYLTASDVNNNAFSAVFSIDFVSTVNNKNAMGVLLGEVESAWTDTAGSLPLYEWADLSTNQTTVVNNVKTASFDTYTLDVTSTIQDWINGVSDNYGFVLFADSTVYQGAGFNNASLVVNVPAPSTIAIFGLALVGLSLARKAKKQS
ncbi:PEP-CTERM sorting domain-containing protein [Psychromonas sp. 14N.309.X.WAT.B.A12]|uniref:PEP-CTERM sorting domain-containing protein n=2 Tax=unclassified Psychromonas TaxID=2614957 RepID=UPI0025B208AC|nr:PEP-CTERM sorting domain-containing protein [Psychromonas sp. 14N.309.X.WAT.B.A12]MDN2664961.1 PEP-CTERM sorting domain-containing protein [Psychromonas sp. 14N.309.X.WAT.B.A12]